jgi:dTDP-4-amino-4,6-dideoxygalactose transaminase
MRIPFLDLAQQLAHRQTEIETIFATVLQRGPWVGGPCVKEFETAFAAYCETAHCISCGNGTDSLFAALKMLGIGAGDDVITPAWSWISTAETISLTGAQPVFADVDAQTFTLAPNSVAQKITPRTKAIIAVHLYGQCCDMTALQALAKAHNLLLIEDAAQAHGARHHGQMAGTMGTVGSFSFYPTKNLGALGDAGCLLTQDAGLALKIRRFLNHGGLTKDEHIMEGMNSRMDALHAAVLTSSLQQLDNWNARRHAIARQYQEALGQVRAITLPAIAAGNTHVFHLFVIRAKQRNALKQFLAAADVETLIHYPQALPFEPAYAHHRFVSDDFPVASQLPATVLSLPCHPYLTDDEVNYICDAIKKFDKQF